jgi:hypothetical protein
MPSVSQAKNRPATPGGWRLSFLSTAFHSGDSACGSSCGSSSSSSCARWRSTTSRVRTMLACATVASAVEPLRATVLMVAAVSVRARDMAWCSASMLSSRARSTPTRASIGQM